jgi:putative solute:sodium symporter small subunit
MQVQLQGKKYPLTRRQFGMQLTQRHVEYWKRNLNLTIVLMAIWFIVTFVMAWFAIPLAEVTFLGWPLSFYMAAQGSLIIYVVIIWFYAKKMRSLDEEYGVAEAED